MNSSGSDIARFPQRDRSSVVLREGEARGPTRAVAAIGNFDGVHLGHQSLLDAARRRAGADLPVAVLTFEPHPRDVFRPNDPGFRLTSPLTKLKILAAFGVDVIFLRRFDLALAGLSAESFVDDVLFRELGLSAVIVGTNFRFGRDRVGGREMLSDLAGRRDIDVLVEPPFSLDGAPVSSSRIRDALEGGRVEEANRLLGHRWFVSAEVEHGEKRGRTLGFPTANCRLDPGCRLRHGIYAVRVAVPGDGIYGGVASFGRRPTFDNGAPLLETFLFGFAGDLYGQRVEIEFLDWIRGEERFGSADDLVAAMNGDADRARSRIDRPDDALSLIG